MIFERKTAGVVVAVLFAFAFAASCRDVSPIVVASSSNASNRSRECAACYLADNAPGPGCANEVNACFANPKCQDAFQCSVQRGCFQASSESLIRCGTACATEAGFTSLDDQAFALANKVYGCLLTVCKDACFGPPSDGGIADGPLDVTTSDGAIEAAAQECLAPGTLNELGIGGFCKSSSECTTGEGLRLCTADFGGGTFCTGLCSADSDCGRAAYCAHTAQGSGCVPVFCNSEGGVPTDGAAE